MNSVVRSIGFKTILACIKPYLGEIAGVQIFGWGGFAWITLVDLKVLSHIIVAIATTISTIGVLVIALRKDKREAARQAVEIEALRRGIQNGEKGKINSSLTSVLIGALLLFSVAGCRNPEKQLQRDEQRIAALEKKKDANDDKTTSAARAQVFATGESLRRETNRTPAIDLAAEYNTKAQLILGPPAYSDAILYERIITQLLSENEEEKARGRAANSAKDREIVALQHRNASLSADLEREREIKARHDKENAAIATSYLRLKWWVKWGIAFAVGVPLLLVLLFVAVKVGVVAGLPGAGIVSELFDRFLGGIGRGVFKVAPRAYESAGVVSANAFAELKNAFYELVDGIQGTRKDASMPADAVQILDQRLAVATAKKEVKALVKQAKEDLNLYRN